ncbi:ComEC/Rec2 family competence protein [Afifella pfennigii]|uniref:ComEC/Rec2 family competence protein n=1 Tax=Afifella pfennigii TaxID=209897 RepID=UPI00068A006E|nr:ComEC/Rec2 family competence protein [Afifella pfennigii]
MGEHTQTASGGFSRYLPPGRLRRWQWRASDHLQRLARHLARDLHERRGFLFLAVAFCVGALIYFALPREPLLAGLVVATGVFAGLAISAWWRGGAFSLFLLLAVLLAGASAAKLRVELVKAPLLQRAVSADISGRVVKLELRAGRAPRAVLDRVVIAGMAPERTPKRIRLTFRGEPPPLGARVGGRARLSPVPGPAVPGGYDPARAAFFQGIGAAGFVFGAFRLEAAPAGIRPLVRLAAFRRAIAQRILDTVPGPAGPIAAALLVGERGMIGEEEAEVLRVAGLAHILAISGLHMMLIAGTAFWLVRALLALSQAAALNWPLRKVAALLALTVGAFYLAISGGNVATIRAFIMAAVMFTAILLDRPALSLRNLAIAAFITVLMEPESVVEPGFQMSFAAVAALIAGWEAWRERPVERLAEPPGWAGRLAGAAFKAVFAIALTTLIAGLATAPFAAYHFGRFAAYSLLGNLLAMPLVSLLVMPAGLLTLLSMPFGLDPVPLALMAAGIESVLAVAAWVAELPGSSLAVAPFPAWTLLVMTAGFLWLCLWRSPVRLYGLVPLFGGVLLAGVLAAHPDLIVDETGKAVAARGPDGALRVEGARAGSYLADVWLKTEQTSIGRIDAGFACDDMACLFTLAGGARLSHIVSPFAFAEDCARAAIVVSALPAPPDCRAPLVIDRAALSAHGAHALYLRGAEPSGWRLATARPTMRRPWQGEPF